MLRGFNKLGMLVTYPFLKKTIFCFLILLTYFFCFVLSKWREYQAVAYMLLVRMELWGWCNNTWYDALYGPYTSHPGKVQDSTRKWFHFFAQGYQSNSTLRWWRTSWCLLPLTPIQRPLGNHRTSTSQTSLSKTKKKHKWLKIYKSSLEVAIMFG